MHVNIETCFRLSTECGVKQIYTENVENNNVEKYKGVWAEK